MKVQKESYTTVKLRATQTARDAIGARVTVRFDNRNSTRQLLAGDGYMASNERVVHFGLGKADHIDDVTIQWPSGATSKLKSPPIDSTFFVVEGSDLASQSAAGAVFRSFPVDLNAVDATPLDLTAADSTAAGQP